MDTNDPNYSPYSSGFSGPLGIPSPEQAAEAADYPKVNVGDSSYRTAAEQKKVEVRAKLDQLEREVLDIIHEEHKFTSSPNYKRMTALANKSNNPSDEEISQVFSDMKNSEGGIEGFADFILKAMDMPSKRARAVSAYSEYRSMASDMGLL